MDKSDQKNKTSCLTCRRRKKKCLGGNPCHRCKTSNAECIYTFPAQKGRPPKNTVINKISLVRGTKGIAYLGSTMCKEFIFEQFSYGKVVAEGIDPAYKNTNKGDNTLSFFLAKIYLSFFGPNNEAANAIAKMRRSSSLNLADQVKMMDVHAHFTWALGQVVNILIRRFSRLKLESISEPIFISVSLMVDDSSSFFGRGPRNSDILNPLKSLPPQQAMRMIDCFFCIHPFCHLLNKTVLLQSYWNDSADSLLMAVIYGTTAYYSNLLEGQPLFLWETARSKSKRNTFLDYAYHLLENADPKPTLARYQAVVILGLFEAQYGFSKKGVSLFALTYVLNKQLGVSDPEARARMTEVEREMLIMAFWAGNNCIIRGCLELDQVLDEMRAGLGVPFPPVTAESSVSFLYDAVHKNNRAFSAFFYLVESFYAESVIAYFASRLFYFFPQSGFNLFDIRWPQVLFQTSKAAAEVEVGIRTVLREFTEFVEDNRHLWSRYQQYVVGATLLLYHIHFSFVKDYVMSSRMVTGGAKAYIPPPLVWMGGGPCQQEENLGLDDIDVILKIDQVAPMASELVNATLEFLADPNQYDSQWLPESIIVSCLETSARIAMLKFKRDRDLRSWQDMEVIGCLAGHAVWRTHDTSFQKVKAMVADFILSHPAPFPDPQQQQHTPGTATASTIQSIDETLALVQTLSLKPCLYDPETLVSSLPPTLSDVVVFSETVSSTSNSISTPFMDGLFTVEEWLDH